MIEGYFNPTGNYIKNSNQIQVTDYLKVWSDGSGNAVMDIQSLK